MSEIYVAVDPATVDPFEFITDSYEAVSEWIDEEENRFYHETVLSDREYVQELIEAQQTECESANREVV